MASVEFTRLWLTPVNDPAAGVGFRLNTLTKTPQAPGEVRQYGDRLRAVLTGVGAGQWSVTLFCDDRSQVEFLRLQQGLVVCAREPRGEKMYAVFFNPQIPEQRSPDVRVSVTLTLDEVSFSEAV